MAENTDIVKAVVSGLVTGGTSAATTFLTVFRNVKARVKTLEDSLGNQTDPKTGLYLMVATLEDSVRRLKRDIDSWDDTPPDWAKRLVNRAKVNASSDLNTLVDIESRVDARLRAFNERLASLEQDAHSSCNVSREEYLEDSKRRAAELGDLREQVAKTNGMMKGVLAALGRDTDA